MRRFPALCAIGSAALIAAACGGDDTGGRDQFTVIAAGDIADCASNDDEKTAALLATEPGTILTLGDNAYEDGTEEEFADCYEPSWGREKARTFPSVGNHEYGTADASGYFDYFGSGAGDPSRGYYSFDLGDWHLIALNSNCGAVGGCNAGSLQEEWLRADLEASSAECTLVYFHHARFSSGSLHGSNSDIQAFWQALYDHRAEIVLSGHDHNYERFAPQTPTGELDEAKGIREFVVGTGGKTLRELGELAANSQVFDSSTFGVLKLTLSKESYEWEFVPAEVGSFTDSGSGTCH